MKQLIPILAFLFFFQPCSQAQSLVGKSSPPRFISSKAGTNFLGKPLKITISSHGADTPTGMNQPAPAIRRTHSNAPRNYPQNSRRPLWLSEKIIGTTTYDLQTNGSISSRLVKNSDGTISAAWNYSSQPASPWSDRGTGYNYFDPNNPALWINGWYDPVSGSGPGLSSITRTEGGTRTGFTNIVVTASGKEMSIAHTGGSGLLLNWRPVKGTGSWAAFPTALNSSGAPNNDTWAKAVSDGESIHVISHATGVTGTSLFGQDSPILYSRSDDGGVTWPVERIVIPQIDSSNYVGFGGDVYSIDARNGVVAIGYSGPFNDVGILKSTDGGQTWTKSIVQQCPIPLFRESVNYTPDVDGDGTPDAMVSNGKDVSVLIDNNGQCHVFFSLMYYLNDDLTDGSYSYYPLTDGICYWNESMPTDGYSIIAGALDENNNGFIDLPSIDPNCSLELAYYGGTGISGLPSSGIDSAGNLFMTYQSFCESCDTTTITGWQGRRHVYLTCSKNNGQTWSLPIDIVPMMADSGDGEHQEAVFSSIAKRVDSRISILYQRDPQPGHSLSVYSTCEQQNNSGGLNNDLVYAEVDANYLLQNLAFNIVATVASAPICGDDTAIVIVGSYGGTPPFIGEDTLYLPIGTHTISWIDAIGDTATTVVTINQQLPIIPAVSAGTISCYGGNTQLIVTATGGVPPYSGTGTYNFSAGTHYWDIMDSRGCIEQISYVLTQPTQLQATAGISDTICRGDTIQLGGSPTVTGGTPPFTYQWSPASGLSNTLVANPNASPTSTTLYRLTVTDSAGCTQSSTVNIAVIGPNLPVLTSTPICSGVGYVQVANSNLNQNYAWSNGASTANIQVGLPGNYTVITTDAAGCTSSATTNVTTFNNCSGILSLEPEPSINYFDTLEVNVFVRFGVGIFSTYATLRFDSTLLQLISSVRGTYLGNNVIFSQPVLTGGSIDFGMTKTAGQSGSYGDGLVYSFRFVIPNLPSGPSFNPNIPSFFNTLFRLSNITVYDTTGVIPSSFSSISIDSAYTAVRYYVPVWPGDLNNDYKVNVADVLPIGYFYNSNGPARPNGNLVWNAQPSALWGYNKTSTNSNAYKTFADANADGIISLADQSAIGFNLNRQHARRTFGYRSLSEAPASSANLPLIGVSMPDNSVNISNLPQIETADVVIGDPSNVISSLYGVAFDLYFNPQFINTSNISLDFNGSVLGQLNNDFIATVDTFNASSGIISIGLTRFGNSPVVGSGGLLVKVGFELATSAPLGWFSVGTSPIACNDQLGNPITVGPGADSLEITNLTGVNEIEKLPIRIYPNPATDHIVVELGPSGKQTRYRCQISDYLGRVVSTAVVFPGINHIDLKTLDAKGCYQVYIVDSDGAVLASRKITKTD